MFLVILFLYIFKFSFSGFLCNKFYVSKRFLTYSAKIQEAKSFCWEKEEEEEEEEIAEKKRTKRYDLSAVIWSWESFCFRMFSKKCLTWSKTNIKLLLFMTALHLRYEKEEEGKKKYSSWAKAPCYENKRELTWKEWTFYAKDIIIKEIVCSCYAIRGNMKFSTEVNFKIIWKTFFFI